METPAFAEVVVATGRPGTLTYGIPPALAGQLQRGQLVQVPLGKSQRPALVVAVYSRSEQPDPRSFLTAAKCPHALPTRPLARILNPEPVVGEREIELAHWLSERYLAPFGRCLWLFVPRGSLAGRDWHVQLLDEGTVGETLFEHQLLAQLRRRGALWGRQLSASMRGMPWRQAMEALAARGVVTAELRLRPPTKRRGAEWFALGEEKSTAAPLGHPSKRADLLAVIRAAGEEGMPLAAALAAAQTTRATMRVLAKASLIRSEGVDDAERVRLAVSSEEAETQEREWRRDDGQRVILAWLAEAKATLSREELRARGAAATDLRLLLAAGRIVSVPGPPTPVDAATLAHYPRLPPRLTPDQEHAWRPLAAAIAAGEYAAFLLHGVTGSGKTELYLRAIERALAAGRSAILLVPEIALTAQTLARVEARFPGQVAAVHSGVPERERQDIARRARAGELRIVVGARSALFTPLQQLGLVILDEEHDASYQQTPPFPPPYYHARALAEEMMRRAGGLLLLGSATPALESYWRARQAGELGYLRLPKRILGHRQQIVALAKRSGRKHRYTPLDAAREETLSLPLPRVQIVDMRQELAMGNRALFSRALRRALGEVLERDEQAMLYLNRRGLHTYIFCRDCGGVLSCLRCDAPLTQHDDGRLRCHHCGATRATPARCPRCASYRIRFYGAGTQQLQRTLAEHFPRARSLRWDADTARRPEEHERILRRFLDGEAQVLIGTQMIAKGLDLPLVTLVGVVSADRGLALPDFRATERVFQLLTQVAGRAGRGILGGRVLLQTYRPEHYAIRAAAQHDYAAFAEQELALRRELGDPPFGRLARIVCRHKREARAQAEAEKAAAWLRERVRNLRLPDLQVVGPLPCYYTRLREYYRWQVLLRGNGSDAKPELVFLAQPPRRGWTVELDPLSTL